MKNKTTRKAGGRKGSDRTEELSFNKKYEKYLEHIRKLTLLDDAFMQKVFEDKECTELTLKIILERDDLNVLQVNVQYDIKNLQGRSIRLDILAVDENKKYYNIEVQNSDSGAVVKRARYNSSILDANITDPGDKYNALHETYVIFITENDIIGSGLPIYHIERTVQETGKLFNDEEHIIYVNSSIKSENQLGRLMHDFSCTDAKEMNYKILAERVKFFKEDVKGVESMSKVLKEIREEGREEGRKEGIIEEKERREIQMAIEMLANKEPIEKIVKYSHLTVEQIKELSKQIL